MQGHNVVNLKEKETEVGIMYDSKILQKTMAYAYKDESWLKKTQEQCSLFLKEENRKATELWDSLNHDEANCSKLYNNSLYLGEMFSCWKHITHKVTVGSALKYLRENVKDYEKLSYFDDYNGVGLSTYYFKSKGLDNIEFFNDVEQQLEIFKWICQNQNIKMPVNNLKREGQFDAVFSFEIAEHYKKPLEYIRGLDKMIKPNGLLFYASGFSKVYAGHFDTYDINGKELAIRQAGIEVGKFIKRRYDLVHTCFNCKPFIYRKRG